MVLPTIGSESFPRTKRFDMKERLALVHNAKMRTKGVRSRSRAESTISRGEPHLGDTARMTESLLTRSTDAAHAPSLACQVDVAALEAQIAEKAARKQAEIEYDRCAPRPRARLPIAVGRPSRSTTDDDADGSPSLAPRRHHDKMASFIDKKLVVLEQERREVQAALNRNVADFRREHQVRAYTHRYTHHPRSRCRTRLRAPPRRGGASIPTDRRDPPRRPSHSPPPDHPPSIHAPRARRRPSVPHLPSISPRRQARTRRREYDLSDPSSLRASLPARVGDDDPRTGVSSLQKFEGEDLAAGARRKAQSAQAAAWYDAQAAEKASARRRAAEEDRARGALIDAQTAYQRQLAEAQKIAREDFERSVAEENARLAEERRAAAAAAAAESESTTAAELERAAADPTLAEDPALAVSALAPGRRVRVDHWKGMSREEIRGVTEMQATQRAEREAAAAAVAREDAADAARSEGIRRALEMRAEQVEAFKAEQRAAVHATIVAQREAKARRDADERADRFREGTFGPEYFAGFGTSAR